MPELNVTSAQSISLTHYEAAPKGQGNLQVSISFGEAVESSRVRQAWEQVMQRHPVLRSIFFRTPEGSLVMRESEAAASISWNEIDWKSAPLSEISEKWNSLLKADAAVPFQASKGPLVRLHEIHLPDHGRHYLFTIPSFLLDRHSISRVLIDWLLALEQPLSAAIESAPHIENDPSASLSAWKEILDKWENPLELHPRLSHSGSAQASIIWDRDQTSTFLEFCKVRSLDAEVVLRSLWALVLRRFGATGNVCLSLYDSPHISPIAGYFENWLPVTLSWKGTVEEWLTAAQKQHEAILKNIPADPEKALREAGCPFTSTELSTAFAWREGELNDIIHTALPRWINVDARICHTPSDRYLLEAYSGPRLQLRAGGPNWTEAAARDLLERVSSLLQDLENIRTRSLSKISVLHANELRTLREWTRGPEALQHPSSIIAAFQEVVNRHPQKIAVQYGDHALSYAELHTLSDKLAAHFAQAGLTKGWNVALFLSSSSWIPIALLGVWKAGNVCMALDPSSPPEWIESTLALHDAGVVLCDAASAPLLDPSERRRIIIDQEWENLQTTDLPSLDTKGDTPAAILAGHGDSAPPEIRALTQEMLLTACCEGARVLGFGPDSIFLAHATAGGGAFYDEWLIPLFAGGTVRVADDDLLDAATAPVTHLRLTAPEWANQAARWSRGEKPLSDLLQVVAVEAGMPNARILETWNEHAPGRIRTIVFFSPMGLCGLGVAGMAHTENTFLSVGKPTGDVKASVHDGDLQEIPCLYAGPLTLKFPGWKNISGISQHGLQTGLLAWRDMGGNLHLESATSHAPGIPDAAKISKYKELLEHAWDVHIGSQTWILGNSSSSHELRVAEWPLTRAGWIDESALPQPESPRLQLPPVAAPAPRRSLTSGPWKPITVMQEGDSAAALVLIHPAAGDLDLYGDLITALGKTRRILGITARGAHDPDACHLSVESAAAAYIDALLEEDPSSAFALSGFGFGAIVALEMARQLKAAGRPQPKLSLLGTYAPLCEKSRHWISSVKNTLKQLVNVDRMEPYPASNEPALTHKAVWRQYRFISCDLSAQIVLPSNFSHEAVNTWQEILPQSTIHTMKCEWHDMLTFPAVKRLASIINNES